MSISYRQIYILKYEASYKHNTQYVPIAESFVNTVMMIFIIEPL